MRETRHGSLAMFFAQVFLVSALVAGATLGLPARSHRGAHGLPIPPKARYPGAFGKDYNAKVVAERVGSWKPEDKQNPWELSGLFEGDIMINPMKENARNGLLDETTHWPGGVVPLYIEEEDFDQEDMSRIKAAVMEYHQRTCLRFRPYKETDEDYVRIQGSASGCWSSVGRQGGGQVLNLQNPGCMRHGTIVHEMMHALGFYHQQSAADRDEYVKIHWDNIQPGKESNFNKYEKNEITDYGVSYDYGSVMHYSGFAFSSNGERTIEPLDQNAEIGQRIGMSEKDVMKLQAMYRDECGDRQPEGTSEGSNEVDSLVDWLFD